MTQTSEIDLAKELVASGLLEQSELDAMIAGTETDEIPGERVVDHETLEEVVDTLATDELRAEAYSAQTDTLAVPDENDVIDASSVPGNGSPARKARSKAAKAAKTPGAKRVSRAASAGSLADYAQSLIPADPAIKGIVEVLPKKCQEKAANWYASQVGKAKLSVFTQHALNVLDANGGSVTSKELVSLYQGIKYSVGTARSQAQQEMTILPALGLATKTGSVLTINKAHPHWNAATPAE